MYLYKNLKKLNSTIINTGALSLCEYNQFIKISFKYNQTLYFDNNSNL